MNIPFKHWFLPTTNIRIQKFILPLIFLINTSFLAQADSECWTIWLDETQPDTFRLSTFDRHSYQFLNYEMLDSFLILQEEIYCFAMERGLPEWEVHSLKMRGQAFSQTGYNLNDIPFYEHVIDYYNQAIEKAKEINSPQLPRLYSDRGTGYKDKGDLNQAMEDYLLTYHLLENKTDSVSQQYLGMTSFRLGMVYSLLGDTETAGSFWERALTIAENNDILFIKANALNQLSYHYYDLLELEKAEKYAIKAYQINQDFSPSMFYRSIINLTSIKIELKKTEEALVLVEEYRALALDFGWDNPDIMFHDHTGKIHLIDGNWKEAQKHYEIALDIAYANNDEGAMATYIHNLGFIHKQLGNYEAALNYWLDAQAMEDSLVNLTKQREIYQLESKFIYEQEAFADSLAFAQKELITQATLKNQRLGLIATISALLFLIALAYFIFRDRQRAKAEANRVKELDAFKSTFYTNITHEFRTPLTVILGMIREIEENPKKNLKQGITLIERNGKNLLSQINQILDLSKLETKSFNLKPIKDDLVSFVRYATLSFQSNANSRNLSLRFFSPIEKLMTNFDPDAIQKIVQNLVSNAIKYTPSSGEVKVYLKPSGKGIEIKVQDTGVGISEADLANIFDRFYQIENPVDKTIEGTGIGLAYVKELVRVMKGEISVKSEAGKGTEFLVKLPLVNDELRMMNDEYVTINKTVQSVAVKSQITPVNIPKKEAENSSFITHHSSLTHSLLPQLLIIEDNPDVIAYLKNCLADQYNIDIAYNGRIGIDKAFENIPDLIITDVMMPEVGGYQVCDTLKTDERTSHIPIIMLTAKADLASKIAGLKRGADAYLSKPFDKQELIIRMKMMIERQRKLAAYFSNILHNGAKKKAGEIIGTDTLQTEDVFLQKVKNILEENYSDEHFGLPQLCSKLGMSRSQLFRKLKALINESPSAFIRNYRLNKAKELLEKRELNVSETAWEAGFTNLAHFSKVFQEKFGIQPSSIQQ